MMESIILDAIRRVVDPTASNEHRLQAYHVIEQLREGPVEVLARVAFFLVEQTDDLVVQHNGWNLVNDLIRYKWLSLDVKMRLEVRNRVLHVVERGPNSAIVEQLASCVETMLEHEWPQNWPTLTEDLQRIANLGLLQTSLVFTVFRRLVENVVTLPRLSVGARKKDLSMAINDQVCTWVMMAIERLSNCTNDEAGSQCAVRVIDLLTECVEWMPLRWPPDSQQTTEDNGGRLLALLVDALHPHLATSTAGLYEHVANCLTGIAARKKDKKTSGCVIEAFFRQAPLEAILRTTSLAAEEAHTSKQHYSYLKALAVLLITLGNNLSQEWTQSNAKPPFFDVYLSAAVALFYHPSMILKYESLEVFVMLRSNTILQDEPTFNEAIQKILTHMPEAMQRRDTSSRTEDAVYRHFSQMDFDSEMERQEQFIKLRTRIQPFVTSCIPKHLTLLLSLVNDFAFQRVLNRTEIAPQEWEPVQKFAKFVLQTAAEKKAFNDEQFEALYSVSERLVDQMITESDWNRLSEVMSVHSAMIFVYERHAESMNKYLQYLHRCLSESQGHQLLNRHCISQLLRLVNIYPQFFESKAELVVSICRDVEGKISAMQMAQLVQILAALSNAVPFDQKCQLLEMAVAPSITYFQGITQYLQSAETFLTMNGFDLEAPATFDESDNRPDIQRRRELRRHLTTIEGVLQQVNSESPLGQALTSIVPVFFQIAKALHDLYSENAQSKVHPSYGVDIAGITHAERQMIYCSNGENMEALTGRSIEEKREPNTFAKQFVNDLNEHILSIISHYSTKFPSTLYSIPEITNLLAMTTWNIEKIPSFRLRFWIKKIWKSLLMSCPPERFSFIAALFATIADHMLARLETIWQQVNNIDYDAEPTEEELFNEHLCAVLSREYVNFLRAVYLANESASMSIIMSADEKRPQQQQYTSSELGKWLIENQIGLPSTVKTSFSALSWRDTQCVTKSVNLCRMFIETIPLSSDEVCIYMLVSVLSPVQIHGADPTIFALLSSLVFQTYAICRKHCNCLLDVIAQIPNISQNTVEKFDAKVKDVLNGVNVTEKEKKTITRNLLQSLVEPLLSEQHKRPFTLRELPPLYRKPKIARDNLNDNEDSIDPSVLFNT